MSSAKATKAAGKKSAKRRAIEYRCEASSVEGFIQQLAVSYVKNGYFFYVTGTIPESKDPRETDQKILTQYGIEVSKFTRARRKKAGSANLHYLRQWAVLRHLGDSRASSLFRE